MMPRVQGLLETALYVDDMARSVAFFRDVIGLATMLETKRLTAFDAGRQGVLLVFQRGASVADMPGPGGVVPGHDGQGPLHMAFAIAEESYDESRDAAVLAQRMRTRHVPVRTDEETLLDALRNVTTRFAEPLADPAILPTFLLARAAREHVKVVLSGEGADELFGGYDAYREMTERTDHKKFTYIWDQHHYDPVTGHMTCHIHFVFPDGSKMKNAFSYEWRLWSLPELQELLYEAGFQRVIVYWQGTEEGTNEGNGVFEPAEHGDADPAWICFISAEK